ncbi:periplasmic heavy metal sensor [Aestuariibius insulae]|uniref:periplasmic heavy metal sensor n=1 Tax=Aestuariibius insulae TaxID=2058287 RepID=UPI00345E0A37
MRTRTRYLLIGSLVLNGLLIGFILGDLSRPVDTARALSQFNHPYPEEMQRDLRRGFRQNRAEIRGELRALAQSRRDLLGAMADPGMDRAEIASRMADIRTRTTALQERFQGITLDVVDSAAPEIRGQIRPPSNRRGQDFFSRALGD